MTSLERLEEQKRAPVCRRKRTTAAAWQWIRNSWTPSKSGLRQSKNRTFPRGRSGTFRNAKGKEKSPSTLAKNVTQPSPHKRTTAAAWGNGFETAEHHLHPGSGKAKTDHSPGAEVAPLEPLEEKTRGPVRRHKRTQRQPLGNGSETAEHHLNPGSGKAKNYHSPGAEVAPLEPLKEKKKAPVVSKKRDAT